MMNPSSPPPSRWMALFLSGLVLPGLGQVQCGEKKKGWAMILIVIAVFIFTLGKFMMGVLVVAEKNHFARPPSLQIAHTLLQAFQMEKTWILGGLILTLLIWILSVLDLMFPRKGGS